MSLRHCSILTILLALGGAVAVQAATANNNQNSNGNPYQEIVTRNVFGLVPIPVGPPPKPEPTEPLPKITPNGIMTLFGKLQVLFKVAQPGKPASDEDSYVMSVGDRQDDIEVQKIDQDSATITFNNHGTIQELPLVVAKASAGAPPPPQHGTPGRIPLPRPGIPEPRGGNPSVATTIGNHYGQGGNNSGGSPGVGGGPAGGGTGANSEQTPKITPEEQVIMIEANRLKAIEDGNETAPLYPITPLTSQTLGEDSGDSGGNGK